MLQSIFERNGYLVIILTVTYITNLHSGTICIQSNMLENDEITYDILHALTLFLAMSESISFWKW